MDTDLRTAELAAVDLSALPNASAAYWRMRCADAEQRHDQLEEAFRRTIGDRWFRRTIIGTALLLLGYIGGVLAS